MSEVFWKFRSSRDNFLQGKQRELASTEEYSEGIFILKSSVV